MVWMPFHPARREACGVEAAMKPGRLSALLTFAGVPFPWLMAYLISTTSSSSSSSSLFVLRNRSLDCKGRVGVLCVSVHPPKG